DDSRWVHRPYIDWDKAALRHSPGTVEYAIFSQLKTMIAVHKELDAFADFNNRDLLEVSNPHLFVFERYHIKQPSERVLLVSNFDRQPQLLDMKDLSRWATPQDGKLIDAVTGKSPEQFDSSLVIPGFGFYWLIEQ
ncbi:MAG: alpha-amylase, partial [Methylophaga sp.]